MISLISLWIAVRNVEWTQAANAIRRVEVHLLIVSVTIVVAGIFLRAERWRVIIAKPIARGAVYQAAALGFFFNYTYPARAGDVIKVIGLKRSTEQSIGRLGISAVLDRLIDVLVLLCAATILFAFIPSDSFGKGFYFLVLAGLVLVVVAAFSPIGEKCLRFVDRCVGHREVIWRITVKKALAGFLTFRREMAQASRLIMLASVSGLVAVVDYFTISYFLQTFGWHLPALAPVVIWVFVSAGAALPSAPAGIGIHQLACVLALKIYDISPGDAFTFSIVLQLGSYLAIILSVLGCLGRQLILKQRHG